LSASNKTAFEWIARVGYGARGIVFLIVGAFMLLAAAGSAHGGLETKDALRALLLQPFGEVLLAVIAAGLMCFALWRLTQSVLDSDHCGRDARALARRSIYGLTALFYIAFAGMVVQMMIGSDAGGNSDQLAHEWTAWALSKPFGRWIIGAAGFGIAVGSIVLGFSGGRFDERRLPLAGKRERIVRFFGRLGFVARSAVFAVIGFFLLFAAIDANSREAKGMTGALRVIQQQPYGPALLGATAVGFIAFGLYGVVLAGLRQISAPSLGEAERKLGLTAW
jgi:Domain of Unknown Function (DUF1206)